MKSTYKILVCPVPLSGHINPLLPLLKEIMVRNKNVKVIVYTTVNFQSSVESIGAEFRMIELTEFLNIMNNQKPFNNKREFQLFSFLSNLLRLPGTYDVIQYCVKDIAKEEPDLILYDTLNPVIKVGS